MTWEKKTTEPLQVLAERGGMEKGERCWSPSWSLRREDNFVVTSVARPRPAIFLIV